MFQQDPFGNQANDDGENDGSGWAQAFEQPINGFARPPLREALPASKKGKDGKSGIQVKAAFRRDGVELVLNLEISNLSGQTLSDFDLALNKNPFGIAVRGASDVVNYPPPGQTTKATLPCAIDKKNLDAKNPP